MLFDLSPTYLDIVLQCRYIKHTFRTTILAPASGRTVYALYRVVEHATLYTRDAARLRFLAQETNTHHAAGLYGLIDWLQPRATELKFVMPLKIHGFEGLTGHNSQTSIKKPNGPQKCRYLIM